MKPYPQKEKSFYEYSKRHCLNTIKKCSETNDHNARRARIESFIHVVTIPGIKNFPNLPVTYDQVFLG